MITNYFSFITRMEEKKWGYKLYILKDFLTVKDVKYKNELFKEGRPLEENRFSSSKIV